MIDALKNGESNKETQGKYPINIDIANELIGIGQ